MSTLATARALPRSTASHPRAPRELKVVSADQTQGYGGLMATCLALLVAGLLGVLMLNISMAKGAFALSDLQGQSNELSDSSAALSHAIDAQSAPAELARRALALGMVPAQNAAFLRLSDGKVLGVAAPAKDDPSFTVVADGTSGAAASGEKPAAAPTTGPQPGTTVTRQGSVTTTTVVVLRGKQVETTVTSVDSATGKTESTTTMTTAAGAATIPAPSAQPTPSTQPTQPEPSPTN